MYIHICVYKQSFGPGMSLEIKTRDKTERKQAITSKPLLCFSAFDRADIR